MEYQYYVHKTDILYLPIQMQCAAIQMQYDAMLFETDLYRDDRKGLKFVRGWLQLPSLTLITVGLRSLAGAQPLPSELPTQNEDDEDAEDGADSGDGDGDDEGGV